MWGEKIPILYLRWVKNGITRLWSVKCSLFLLILIEGNWQILKFFGVLIPNRSLLTSATHLNYFSDFHAYSTLCRILYGMHIAKSKYVAGNLCIWNQHPKLSSKKLLKALLTSVVSFGDIQNEISPSSINFTTINSKDS